MGLCHLMLQISKSTLSNQVSQSLILQSSSTLQFSIIYVLNSVKNKIAYVHQLQHLSPFTWSQTIINIVIVIFIKLLVWKEQAWVYLSNKSFPLTFFHQSFGHPMAKLSRDSLTKSILNLPVLCISESCIEIKIKAFIKPFEAPQKVWK